MAIERHLHVVGLDLLAQVLGGAADHQPGDEHRQDGEHQHAVQAGADAAEHHLAELHVDQRHRAAQRRVRVVHRVHRAARGVGGDGGEQPRLGDAEARLLAFHVAAGLRGADALVDAQRGELRVALLLEAHRGDRADREHQVHRDQHRPALALVLHHAAEDQGTAPRRSGRSTASARSWTAASGSRTGVPRWR